MKKFFYVLPILFLIWLNTHSFADECSNSCQISDAPAPALTEYFTNIETLQSNIIEALWEVESEISISPEDDSDEPQSFSQPRAEWEWVLNRSRQLLQTFNSLLNFNDYFGSFDFKIALPITNEVPNEVQRDHRKLETIWERLTSILETSTRRNTSGAQSDTLCDDIDNCPFSEVSIWQTLVRAINNNREIIRLYESSILDKAFLAENRNFILVSDDFESQIQEYYNKDTLWSCSMCEGNTWSETRQRIEDISLKNSEYEAGIQTWRDAWALMRWWNTANNVGVQNRVLSEYLATQWISWWQADVVLDNLNRYSSWGVTGSNPGLNSANYASVAIENRIDSFSQTLSEQFEWRDRVPIVELAQVNSEIKSTENLALWISSLYEELIPYSQAQDIWAQQLQVRILRMHASLMRSINELQKNQSLSEQLCDKQWVWDGRCRFY